MDTKEIKHVDPVELTEEEKKVAEELKKNNAMDLRSALINYSKSFNGYNYISASRIEVMPNKDVKHSFLLEQMMVNYLLKHQNKNDKGGQVAISEFMGTFAKGDIVFVQAHQSCPTLAPDGLYNAIDINGKFIKTQLVGHFVLDQDPSVETNDEKIEKGYTYSYKDANDQMAEIQSQEGTLLTEYRAQHGTIYRRLTKPFFEPMIVVRQGPNKFGIIHGNPYRGFSPEEMAAVLKTCGTQIKTDPEQK